MQGLAKAYRGQPALRGMDFAVSQGEIFVLLGPTGAGKSTTLLAIAGLVEPDSGHIRLDGRDLTGVDPGARDIAMVFEGVNLLPTLSTRDNIAFSLRSPRYRRPEDEIARRVERVARDLRIDHLLDRPVETLSGGERQRVAIGRAMVREPGLLLLDEPLSALDLKLREGLQAELRALHGSGSSTVVYATHDYHGAVAVGDRIAIVEDGRVQQCGPIAELLDRPANIAVGRRVGSPGMAFFDAHLEDGHVRLAECELALPLDGLGPLDPAANRAVTFGIWPEDVRVETAAFPGAQAAEIYAVDNRGPDRAYQIHAGPLRLRKVMGREVTLRQGDPCWFRPADGAGYIFDPESGRRLSHAETAGGRP